MPSYVGPRPGVGGSSSALILVVHATLGVYGLDVRTPIDRDLRVDLVLESAARFTAHDDCERLAREVRFVETV